MLPAPDPVDASERPDGPVLVALEGSDDPGSPFRLGTREVDWHAHLRGQVFCVETGLIHVRTARGSWILPPQRAGWMPPGERHAVTLSGATRGWTVLIAPAACRDLPDSPRVFGIGELMRALVRRAVTWTPRDILALPEERAAQVLLDEIRNAPREPLHLPMPQDPRLVRIARALAAQPGDTRSLEEWAAWGALSPRSLRRLMRAETGLSFAQWRQQARLIRAFERLAAGDAVGAVAEDLGYASPSGFIAMFRRATGTAPTRSLAGRRPV
ncbi:AraC family transcriptional regulator [Methylobacterium sp. JK268]